MDPFLRCSSFSEPFAKLKLRLLSKQVTGQITSHSGKLVTEELLPEIFENDADNDTKTNEYIRA